MCLPHGLRDLSMTRLGLLALNGYGNRVIDVLIKSVCNIGWCIIVRQAICWEGMLALELHKMGVARTSQCFASQTYHIRDWMTCLIDAKWVNRATFVAVLAATTVAVLTSIIFIILIMDSIIVVI